MGLLGDLKGPLVGLVVSGVVFVLVTLLGIMDVLGVLTTTAEVTLFTLIATAIPYVIALFLVGLLGIMFLVWGVYRAATNVNLDSQRLQSERLGRLLESAERRNKWLRQFGFAETIRPSKQERAERKLEQLKDDYAAGKLSEQEFERRAGEVIQNGNLNRTHVDHNRPTERERT